MAEILNNLADYLPLSPLATQIGVICLTVQIIFTILFDKRLKLVPEGPWTHLPLFSAHQVVALPLMIVLTYIGWRDWFFSNGNYEDATAVERIFGNSNPNDIPLAIGSGAILLWDIPTGFISPPLRDPIMWAHHIGMFMVASTMCGLFCKWGTQIGYYYAPYYFGVIELSSIFLAYVDIFHPKYKHYYAWLNGKHSDEKSIRLQKRLNDINEIARILFALSFLALRGLYFPYVSFMQAIPDLIVAYETPPDGVPIWTGYFLIIQIGLFACLQAYWGLLIARQVIKVVIGSDGKDKKKN